MGQLRANLWLGIEEGATLKFLDQRPGNRCAPDFSTVTGAVLVFEAEYPLGPGEAAVCNAPARSDRSAPSTEPIGVQRRASTTGVIMLAGQRDRTTWPAGAGPSQNWFPHRAMC